MSDFDKPERYEAEADDKINQMFTGEYNRLIALGVSHESAEAAAEGYVKRMVEG